MQQRQVRKSENDLGVEKSKDPKNEATLDSPKPKQPPIKRRNITFLFVIGNLSIGTAFLLPKEWKLSTPVRNHWLLCLSMIWFGMILAISFMESWVKFKAQSLPKHIGVDVGRTVFWALNRFSLRQSLLFFYLSLTSSVLLFKGRDSLEWSFELPYVFWTRTSALPIVCTLFNDGHSHYSSVGLTAVFG
jgi:hypothetical protein